ncbi:YafY family transcriptional regulator [Paenibacillus sp. IB182496]|uniref:YafY family transcriptional regulator n=1 Tax=Paenibacillus sabuli TaxID=2772509 RepID=A0A927BTI8_9BACL|nr:YafY family protein [Paenibacillus sabuli]MBD2846523.1 YafY family transcriptional regulator [Paenibacillus sabuli]
MNKVERLISIIMILLKKEVVSTTAFAELFDVSKRTILRDMETLSLANIPIYAAHGVNGGYGIMEAYKVDKRLLSNSDLEHILTALGGLEQILVSEEVERTIKKVEAMVGALPLKRSVQLSFYDWEGRSEMLDTIKACQAAIWKSTLVSFAYIDKHGAGTNRRVEPYALHFSERSWYLRGFCLHRQEYRTFKLSRIEQLSMEETTFQVRADWSEAKRDTGDQPPLIAVKALISPSIKDQFIERFGRTCIAPYNSEYWSAAFSIPHNTTGFKFLAGFGTNLRITEPRIYVEEFRSYLAEMMANYTKSLG